MQKENLTIKETFALAFQNHQKNNFKIAESLYNKILETNPNHIESIFLLGSLSAQTKKFDRAKQLLQKTIKINPSHADAHNNLGNVHKELKEHEEAIICYEKAITINPNYAEAHNNLGLAFVELGKIKEALVYCEKAIQIKPEYAEAYYNLGTVFKELEEYQKAINCYEKAIKIYPNYLDAYNNLGIVLLELAEHQKAINCYEKVLKINPNYADAHYNLGLIYEELNEFQKSINFYKKAIEIQNKHKEAYSNLLFNICWSNNNEEYLKIAKKYYATIAVQDADKFRHFKTSNEKILKIGFVSGDFRNHPVGHFLLDTLKNLKKKNLKLFAYSNSKKEDELTNLLKKYFDKWILVVHKNQKNLTDIIRRDNIDILFDLSGHTRNNILPIFKNRCAPIQATWCGWLATTGIREIDYIIGDSYVTPLSDQWKFTEKIYQLKKIWQCMSISDLKSRTLSIRKNNEKFVTFGSFNHTMKINDSVVATWSKILNQIPKSKLLLKSGSFDIPEVRKKFLKKFDNHGINKNQITFDGKSSRSEYLENYNNIDIVLDTFPVNGGTVSFEAAYMGVPVLTKVSKNSFWFRSGESVNQNLNMNEWIAKNEDEYITKAIEFSENKNYLTELKKELRSKAIKSPLFDSESFSDHFYDMLLNIVKN